MIFEKHNFSKLIKIGSKEVTVAFKHFALFMVVINFISFILVQNSVLGKNNCQPHFINCVYLDIIISITAAIWLFVDNVIINKKAQNYNKHIIAQYHDMDKINFEQI